jgi:hypothetical protein
VDAPIKWDTVYLQATAEKQKFIYVKILETTNKEALKTRDNV